MNFTLLPAVKVTIIILYYTMVMNVSSPGQGTSPGSRRPSTVRGKVLIVGEEKVGKSSIVHMITSDGTHFPKQYNMTGVFIINAKSIFN